MKTLLKKSLALGALAFVAATTQGAVLTYGTFHDGDPEGDNQVDDFTGVGSFAVGFTASNSTTYSLSQAIFDLSRDGNRNARLRIYSAGLPGDTGETLLATWTATPAGAGNATTFTGAAVSLVSGTTYWLLVDANGTSDVNPASGSIFAHSASGTDNVTGSSVLSFAGAGHSAGDSPSVASLTSFAGTDIPNFSVTVPEPHEYAMVAGLGLCAFAAYRRRNARVTA